MLDLNHLLLFIAVASSLVMLVRTWTGPDSQRAWRIAACAVLLASVGCFFVARKSAGFVGGGAWLLLLFLPALGTRRIVELAARRRFGAAARLAKFVRIVHPDRGLGQQAEVLRALALAQTGDLAASLRLLASVARGAGDHARHAMAQSFRVRGDWAGLLVWFRAELSPAVQRADLGLLPLYLRALGETGAIEEMIQELSARAPVLLHQPLHAPLFHACLLPVLSFSGRALPLRRLFATTLSKLPADAKHFWIGCSQLGAGETAEAVSRLETLRAKSTDALLRESASRVLASPVAAQPVVLSFSARQLLRPFEREQSTTSGPFGERRGWPTVAVAALILVNLAMFLVEVTHGGSTNPATLHRLGQLEPWSVRYRGEYWRMVTALFLHYGPLHLLFNLYALWVIGPGLERAIGAGRFLFCYLVAGLGSSAGVVLFRMARLTSAEQLVGASGCVMGIVGVWAGFLLRERHAAPAMRQLRSIILIVLVQTAFDLWTPQISMVAHLSGLGSGVALGALVAGKRRPLARAPGPAVK